MRKLVIRVLAIALLAPVLAMSESKTIDKETLLAFINQQKESMINEAYRLDRVDAIIRFIEYSSLTYGATFDVSFSENGAENITTYSLGTEFDEFNISVIKKYSGKSADIWLDFESKSAEPEVDTAIALLLSVQPNILMSALNYFNDIPIIESVCQSLTNGLKINSRQMLYTYVGGSSDSVLNYFITKNQDGIFAHSIRLLPPF